MAGKFTEEQRSAVIALLRAGNYRKVACRAAGVTDRTLRNWQNRAARGEKIASDFVRDIEQAEAEAEVMHVENVRAAGAADWRASSDYLKRKAPSRWGDRVRIEVERELERLLTILQDTLPEADYVSVLERLSKRDDEDADARVLREDPARQDG